MQPSIEESQLLSQVYSEVQERFNQFDDPAHGWEHIQRVYDLVEKKGRIAIQMEYLDGQSLSRLRLTKPNQTFEVRELEKWIQGLCEALEYVHQDTGGIDGEILPDSLVVDAGGN